MKKFSFLPPRGKYVCGDCLDKILNLMKPADCDDLDHDMTVLPDET